MKKIDYRLVRSAKLASSADLRSRRATENRRLAESRWYYTKKAVTIFPGVSRAIAPSFLQSYYRQWEEDLTSARRLLNLATLASYRAWIPKRARQVADHYGLDDRWINHAVNGANKSLIDPHELAIFKVENDEQMDLCLRRFEWARIHKRLVPQFWTPNCRVAHKIDFYLHALENDLPIPTLRAVVQDGRVDLLSIPSGERLVGKPENGRAGRSVFVLDVPSEARRSLESFHEWLANDRRLQTGDWVIQDHISVHRNLAGLGMNALPTVRLNTMLNETGSPELLVAYLRFPSDPNSHVDNFAVGGMMGLIELSSGIMEDAVIMRDLVDHKAHPLTEQPIAGVQIPFWTETCDLVCKAHAKAFGDYRLIGWDIAITDDGPIIIEGNAKPCQQGVQQVQRGGLGNTRFGELISWHLSEPDHVSQGGMAGSAD